MFFSPKSTLISCFRHSLLKERRKIHYNFDLLPFSTLTNKILKDDAFKKHKNVFMPQYLTKIPKWHSPFRILRYPKSLRAFRILRYPNCFHYNTVTSFQSTVRGFASCVSADSKMVYKAQIMTSGSCQGHRIFKMRTKNIRSRYPINIRNIVASRNKQDYILINSHFKSVLHVLYLISKILYNRGIVYVVGYETQILISSRFYDQLNRYHIEIKADQNTCILDPVQGNRNRIGKNTCLSYKSLNVEEEKWCFSSISNWRNNSNQFWRSACFSKDKDLERFAIRNDIDFSQHRLGSKTVFSDNTKKSSLYNQLITVKKQDRFGIETQQFMPFYRKPDLLIFFDAESNRLALKQAKKLQIPTISITDSNMDSSDALYSLQGNHKSIHFLYRVLDCLTRLSN